MNKSNHHLKPVLCRSGTAFRGIRITDRQTKCRMVVVKTTPLYSFKPSWHCLVSTVDRFNLFYKWETQFLLAFIYTMVLSKQSDTHKLISGEGWGSLLDSVTSKVNFHYNLTDFHAKFCSRKHSISSWLNAQLKFVMRKLARVVLSSLGIVKGERNKPKYDRVDEEVVEGCGGVVAGVRG